MSYTTHFPLPAELQPHAEDSVFNHDLGGFYSDYYRDVNGIRPRWFVSVQDAWNWIKRQSEGDVWDAYYELLEKQPRKATQLISSRMIGLYYDHQKQVAVKIAQEHNRRVQELRYKPATFTLGQIMKKAV